MVMQGCYTQLAVFYPDPSIVDEEQSFYNDYSTTNKIDTSILLLFCINKFCINWFSAPPLSIVVII